MRRFRSDRIEGEHQGEPIDVAAHALIDYLSRVQPTAAPESVVEPSSEGAEIIDFASLRRRRVA